MALYKISSSRVNNIEATEYVGGTNELGLIWYDEVDGILRLYNDQPGGKIINNGSGGTPGGANTQVQFNNNGEFAGSAGLTFNSNTDTLSTGSITAVGNVTTDAYFIGNGSQLTGISANYSDSNVVSLLSSFGSNTILTTGNITAGYFVGNGSQLTGISANYSNANVAAFLPTYTGNLVSLAGNITTTANVTAQFFIGDGSQLTGISAQGLPSQNGNAGLYLSTDGSNVVWNGALGSSLTFSGGQSGSDEFGSDLNGGAANDNFIGSTAVLGGNASSDYNLTLSSVALTGQAEDVVISSPPLTANSAGATGQVAFDPQYLYICISNNNWKRADLASW
jgi:hypothetical protein